MSQESLEREGACTLSCPKHLKPRENIRKTPTFGIMAFKLFCIISTFTCVEYNINGKTFWLPPTE